MYYSNKSKKELTIGWCYRQLNDRQYIDWPHKEIKEAIENNRDKLNLCFSSNKLTLLSFACSSGYYYTVKLLLENGANANGAYIEKYGDETMIIPESTPIENVCRKSDCNHTMYEKEIIDILIEYGANEPSNYYNDDYSQQISLLCGIMSGDFKKVGQYLAQRDVDKLKYAHNRTALMYACKNGNFEMALTLISAGADINARDRDNKTVFNYAAEGGNTKIMELLIAQGAKA